MKQNKWKKIVTFVLLFVILFSALCTISTLGYDITLVYTMPDGGQHRVRNPFVKAEILFLVTTLGEGVRTEDSLDLQRTSLAHGGEEFLTIRQNGKVTATTITAKVGTRTTKGPSKTTTRTNDRAERKIVKTKRK